MSKTYSQEEKQEYLNKMQTAGRKGLKLQRLTIAFTPEKYEYLRLMSAMTGMTYSEFINEVLEAHKGQHEDAYVEALKLKNKILESR